MESEEEIIDKLLNQLDSTVYLKYDDVKNRGDEYKRVINKMRSLDFVQIQSIGHYGGHAYISLTAKGGAVVHNGGYEKFITTEREREKREREIYEYTKSTFSLTKKNTTWVIIGALAAIVGTIIAVIAVIK